jgi:hypothetical protein
MLNPNMVVTRAPIASQTLTSSGPNQLVLHLSHTPNQKALYCILLHTVCTVCMCVYTNPTDDEINFRNRAHIFDMDRFKLFSTAGLGKMHSIFIISNWFHSFSRNVLLV